jgi:hypothetical protein
MNEVADEVVEFGVEDEVSVGFLAERAAEDARKAHHGAASAGETIRSAVGTDQLTLNAKGGGLE